MVFDIYNPYANQNVTKDYVRIIEEALNNIGIETQHIEELHDCRGEDRGIVVILPGAVRLARKHGYKKIIVWFQGVSADESFMRHHSYLRYWLLRSRERYALKKASFVLFVSRTMKDFYQGICHRAIDNSYVMPCFNEEIKPECFDYPGKYADNLFVYAGSLAPWQCFEPTVELYSKIEQLVKDCSFRVLVKDKETAERILRKYGVEHHSIDFVPKEQVAEETQKAKFGFCLRENSIVNKVATPTKLSSYVCQGVMPIYSRYIGDFSAIAKNSSYCFCVDPGEYSDSDIDSIVAACSGEIDKNSVLADYRKCFGDYYSAAFHRQNLEKKLAEIFAAAPGGK